MSVNWVGSKARASAGMPDTERKHQNDMLSSKSNDELRYGDSIVLLAERIFGFLQASPMKNEENQLLIRPIDASQGLRTSTVDLETFQVQTCHEYEAQDRLQEFLVKHGLHHPSDVARLDEDQKAFLEEVQNLAEEEIKGNEERQLFHLGRPIRYGDPFQLLHVKTRLFVTLENHSIKVSLSTKFPSSSRSSFAFHLTEGQKGSQFIFDTPARLELGVSQEGVVRPGDAVVLESIAYEGKRLSALKRQGENVWSIHASDDDPCELTIQVQAQAKPALSGSSLKYNSLSQATASAKKELEASLHVVEERRQGIAREMALLDMRLTDVNKGFDQMVLQMMLHFQELHQALEARENQLLSEARKRIMEKVTYLKERREELSKANDEADNGIQFASKVLAMDNDVEMLQMQPHVMRRLSSVKGAVHTSSLPTENLTFRYTYNERLIDSIGEHGEIFIGSAHEERAVPSSKRAARPSSAHAAARSSEAEPPRPSSAIHDGGTKSTSKQKEKIGKQLQFWHGSDHPALGEWLSDLRQSGDSIRKSKSANDSYNKKTRISASFSGKTRGSKSTDRRETSMDGRRRAVDSSAAFDASMADLSLDSKSHRQSSDIKRMHERMTLASMSKITPKRTSAPLRDYYEG
ncbi:hypothetical protein GUITHDRAFT_117609 [Guillardia theta CCMP2712]|uniref:Inositol 1,4,5-trisphosphate/ryanodine receptor domain-containing protein n=1 Tax=Guillardia theta (strain CCMP2712) TaxID=905079 RepID=L1IK07_GUITC|nr:hypothetical protein GUITHDRAFT_117609 [Guillardia theta CCMP2712]EKX36254.1 hypothetical protein GUITHDRAFT_117609 [Guillardia theta CCMP2712]|eukprot:XP_005823234.1 hypothetical protein GUITHDRAFT_117609 [Guillardia theta CCMP2712]